VRAAAIIAGSLALALAGVTSAADRGRPTLTLGGSPLTVRGTNFHPRERVLLLVTGATFVKRAVVTDRNGAFRASVPAASKCRSLTIQAIGAAGERASTGIESAGCGVGLPS
jgi:hypothetical protein